MASLNSIVQPPDSVAIEVFAPPSPEATWLVRSLPWLLAPRDGNPRWFNRLLGLLVVAPFTQFTVVSFELQTFLFNVFHTHFISRLSHGLFMPTVNFFVMVALAQFRLGLHPTAHGWSGPSLSGATIYALVLLTWYLAVAISARLYLWWAVMVPVTLGLAFGADAYYCHTFTLGAARTWYEPTPLLYSPYVWMSVAAFLIAVSHGAEPWLPPRVGDTWRWLPVRESIFGTREAPNPPAKMLVRTLMVATQFVTGSINEWWASPRLMPYNVLVLMFRAGYRPDVWSRAKSFADRAVASGNPALDYIGIGGGAYLRPEQMGNPGVAVDGSHPATPVA